MQINSVQMEAATREHDKGHAGEAAQGRFAMASILIADDHPLFRDALAAAVAIAAPQSQVRQASGANAALEMLASHSDIMLLLLDLRMPDSRGYATLLAVRANHPDVPVIVVTAEESAEVVSRCRALGATGYLFKTASLERMTACISQALAGTTGESLWPKHDVSEQSDMAQRIASLSPTQMRVLLGVLEGRLNKQIAYDLGVSEVTIKAHMTAVFRKLGVINRTQAVLAAQSLGLTPPTAMEAI